MEFVLPVSPDRFKQSLEEHYARPLASGEAADAFHNLTGFLGVLLAVNQRIERVSLDTSEKARKDKRHATGQ